MHEAFLIFREGFNEISLELKMDENIKQVVLLNSAIYLLSDKNRVFLFTQNLDFFVEIIIERKENEYIETIFGQKQSKDEVENNCYLSTNLQRLFLLQESFYQEITYENAKTLMFNNHIFVIDDQCFSIPDLNLDYFKIPSELKQSNIKQIYVINAHEINSLDIPVFITFISLTEDIWLAQYPVMKMSTYQSPNQYNFLRKLSPVKDKVFEPTTKRPRIANYLPTFFTPTSPVSLEPVDSMDEEFGFN